MGIKSTFLINQTDPINLPYIKTGRLPLTESEISLSPEFMQSNHIELGQALTIGDTTYTITGFFYLPDYEVFIPFGDIQQDFDSAAFAIVTPKVYDKYTGKEEKYFAGRVKLQLYSSSYSFPYLARGIDVSSFCYGVVLVIAATVLVTYIAVIQFMKQDGYSLLNNVDKTQNISGATAMANKIANLLPPRWRLPVRVVLRKWNTLLLSALTILIVSTLFITYKMNVRFR